MLSITCPGCLGIGARQVSEYHDHVCSLCFGMGSVNPIFFLGATDPEMNWIEKVLQGEGASIVIATANGTRVHPGNAYACDEPGFPLVCSVPVFIECRPSSFDGGGVVIDHHRPGDPGFGRPAAEYWEASSIGQLFKLLSIDETPEERILAAMDHCFPAAVRGECPGVKPEDVISLKCSEIASGTRSSTEAVEAEVVRFREMIADAPTEVVGEQVLRDLRGEYLGEGYSLALLAAQVAAVVEGVGVILRHRDFAAGPEKWSLSGHVDASTVIAFIEAWAPAHGLVKIYGVPDRGYAGGYLPQLC